MLILISLFLTIVFSDLHLFIKKEMRGNILHRYKATSDYILKDKINKFEAFFTSLSMSLLLMSGCGGAGDVLPI